MLLKAIIAVLVYLLIVSIFHINVTNKRHIICEGDDYSDTSIKNNKWILLFSIVIVLYQIVFMSVKTNFGGDRGNYYVDFIYGRETGFALFDLYLKTIKHLTSSFSLVISITVFIVCFLSIYGLSLSKYFNGDALLFTLCTSFVFDSSINLKQGFVWAFTSLFVVITIEKKFKYKEILLFCLVFLSCGFHVTGYLLIILYFVLQLDLSKNNRVFFLFIGLILAFIFLNPILSLLSTVLKNIFPIVSERINFYLQDEDTNAQSSLLLAAVKGIPYYLLTVYGVLFRKNGKNKFEHYDDYLLIAAIGSILRLTSLYSYWYSRFVALFFVPYSILFSMVTASCGTKTNRKIIVLSILLPLLFITIRYVFIVYIVHGGF